MDSLSELPSRRKIHFFGTNCSVQYSPCIAASRSLRSRRLVSELAVFRPKVDEITLLTINTSSSSSSYCLVRSRLSDLLW
ncbi:unnamed protein product [Brassica oleracea var. botrytis]